MARNSEKAQSMLFRFREVQAHELGIIDAARVRRPRSVASVLTVAECERWRGQCVRDISRLVTRIHDASLSDYQVRDLNDDINKLMREKHAWEIQLRNLGGPNYTRSGAQGGARNAGAAGGEFGVTAATTRGGYQYYGRAKDLPGVKELFEAARASAAAARAEKEENGSRRDDLRKTVDAAYYGYAPGARPDHEYRGNKDTKHENDDDDGDCDEDEDEWNGMTLLQYERKAERDATDRLARSGSGQKLPPGWEPLPGDPGDGTVWQLPTVEEVVHDLAGRRKQRLLDR